MEIKNKFVISVLALILLLENISAFCNETQVNINTAPIEDLDKIINIGSARAQQIISMRPFSSLDELIGIKGVGNITLNEIKAEGLACIGEEEQIVEEEKAEKEIENPTPKKTKEIILTPIALSIKSDNNKEVLKRNLAIAGIVSFCVVFGALFFLRTARRRKENEFR